MHTPQPRLTAPGLTLRPWSPADAPALAELYQDVSLRRWTSAPVHDEPSAAAWVAGQLRGWETGTRLAFAVQDADGRLAGHVVVKRAAAGADCAEVGYWTAPHARGRGVAPRALRTLTDWAFATYAERGLTWLGLLHQAGNTASCRVAEKAGYELKDVLPAAPPAFPQAGHLHIRRAPSNG
ncbi:GNAT family N-acetyltransferase [Streptomyces sp. NPDC052012]|uniref:GNAT family N-acetyltransferase n=1 Tax=Streptomyces sp. NPDC052012 TaxID=3155051 RepID=UPI00344F706E